MGLQEFITDFESQFEGIEKGSIEAATEFKKATGWDSMTAMLVIDMVSEKYGKILTADDLRSCKTVEDLFNKLKD